jgi:hypothetical protein
MKKTLGCLSVYGLLAALVLAIALGLWTLLRGPTMFSPGPLTAVRGNGVPIQGIASHADAEPSCTLCHLPWRRIDPARCLECHTGVADEIAAQSGLHGPLDDPESCVSCHPDHQGREVDIAQAALDRYPHDVVGFTLARHQQRADGTDLVCADCHVAGGGYALDPRAARACAACHRQIDAPFVEQHIAEVGAGCVSCHDGREMPDAFDHAAVFPLDGAHAAVVCDTCHAEPATTQPSAACAACHAEPAVHRGTFGTTCAACHTAEGWLPARLREHVFPLDHGVQAEDTPTVPCLTCHPDGYVAYTCYGCHEHQPDEVERAHRELDEYADCARCHPTGQDAEEVSG